MIMIRVPIFKAAQGHWFIVVVTLPSLQIDMMNGDVAAETDVVCGLKRPTVRDAAAQIHQCMETR